MSGPSEPEKRYADKSVDEVMGGTPLFMNTLNYTDDSAPMIDALQSLVYDGDPVEVADNFRTEANEYFQQRQFKNAIQFYSNALDQVGPQLPAEQKRQLWNNRAAANHELGNYKNALEDLGRVLKEEKPETMDDRWANSWDKTTMKALFRSAKALLALDRAQEALDVLEYFARMDNPSNPDPGAKSLAHQAKSKLERQAKSAAEKLERERRKRLYNLAVLRALHVMGILVPNVNFLDETPPEVIPVHFDPDELPPESRDTVPLVAAPGSNAPKWQPPEPTVPLIFPVALSLPLENPARRDVVMEFHSEVLMGYALEQFGLSTDVYDCYVVTPKGRAFKAGPKSTIQKVAKNAYQPSSGSTKEDGWSIDKWGLEIFVLPKSDASKEWLDNYKASLKK